MANIFLGSLQNKYSFQKKILQIVKNFPKFQSKFKESGYFLFSYSNTFHHNLLYFFAIPLKYFFKKKKLFLYHFFICLIWTLYSFFFNDQWQSTRITIIQAYIWISYKIIIVIETEKPILNSRWTSLSIYANTVNRRNL